VVATLAAGVGAAMRLLDRYLIRQVLWFTMLVAMALVTLAALFAFIEQQDDVGTGSFGVFDAFFVTMLLVPKQAFQLLPIAALIGALLGLGNLARGSELIVFRAAGVSVARIALAAAMGGCVLVLIGVLLGEGLAPPLESYARQVKALAKYANLNYADHAGIWLKDGSRVVSIEQQSADNLYGGIYVYQLSTGTDGRQHLAAIAHADSAALAQGKTWRLRNFASSVLGADMVTTRHEPTSLVQSDVSPDVLGAAVVDPGSLPIRGLYRFVTHLKANGLESRAWEVALWSRIARSLSTVLLCMLAVPFVLGPLRSSGAGSRAAIGIVIGVVYFLINRTLENSGDIYGIHPLVVAWAPVAALALVTGGAIARVR
jgi:lipopolysaccharide export system permease protein